MLIEKLAYMLEIMIQGESWLLPSTIPGERKENSAM